MSEHDDAGFSDAPAPRPGPDLRRVVCIGERSRGAGEIEDVAFECRVTHRDLGIAGVLGRGGPDLLWVVEGRRHAVTTILDAIHGAAPDRGLLILADAPARRRLFPEPGILVIDVGPGPLNALCGHAGRAFAEAMSVIRLAADPERAARVALGLALYLRFLAREKNEGRALARVLSRDDSGWWPAD